MTGPRVGLPSLGGEMTKLRVGLLFGGRSAEHEVSIASASSIHKALDPARYEVSLIAVDRDGRWRLGSPELPPEATVDGREVRTAALARPSRRRTQRTWGRATGPDQEPRGP